MFTVRALVAFDRNPENSQDFFPYSLPKAASRHAMCTDAAFRQQGGPIIFLLIMSNTNSLHYELCRKGASFMRNRKNWGLHGPWLWVAVELVTQAAENCDIWATNGYESAVVEVKVSRADFLRDKKKRHLRPGMEHLLSGNYRYYLAPEGVIKDGDLPEGYGLLVWDGKQILKARDAAKRTVTNGADLSMLCSILRREGILPRILDYRNANPMGKAAVHLAPWLASTLRPYAGAVDILFGRLYGKADPKAVNTAFGEGRLALIIDGQRTVLSYTTDDNIFEIDTRTNEISRIKVDTGPTS